MTYAVTYLTNNSYRGYRFIEDEWELEGDETKVDSLVGLTQITSSSPLSTEDKRVMLSQQFRQLPALTRRAFKQTAFDADGFLRADDIENAIYTLDQAKLQPNADTALIQNMINFLGEE